MKNLLTFTALVLISAQSFAFDIIGSRQAIIVEPHPIHKELRSLKHCLINKQFKVIPETCEQIGSQEYYSVDFLKKERTDEYVEASLKTLADVGIVVVAAYAGFHLGAAALTAEASTLLGEIFFGSIGASAGGVFGLGGGLAIATTFDKLNPVRQFKQAASLSDELINDIDSKESDDQIEETVELLNSIL